MEHSGTVRYAHEIAHKMVRALVLGEGALSQRVGSAYDDFNQLTREQLLNQAPDAVQNSVKTIRYGYDQLRAGRLDHAGVRELAEQIISLDSEASRLFWTWPSVAA